jgi:PAS domain-containing protein
VVDKEGNPKYFVSVIQDISERKQAEEALRQSRDFLEHLISAVPDATFSVKLPERTINWANDSFDVLGYEPEEYIGQTTEKYSRMQSARVMI